MSRARKRVYEVLEVVAPGDRLAGAANAFILALIVLNVAAFMVETLPAVAECRRIPERQWVTHLFRVFEIFSVAAFSVEYALRVWSCVENPRYAAPLAGRLKFALSPMALVDLGSVLPFYVSLAGLEAHLDARVMRVVRLLRIFRVAKLGRYSTALQTLARVARAKKEELAATLSLLVLLLIIASSLIYFAERERQPEQFSSIPAAMWWAIVTLATVGYGDVYPLTVAGKVIGGFIAVLGIGLFALPTGILGAGFMEDVQRRKAEAAEKAAPRTCPHCGRELSGGSG
jgi:voltage-gated potassium channel